MGVAKRAKCSINSCNNHNNNNNNYYYFNVTNYINI